MDLTRGAASLSTTASLHPNIWTVVLIKAKLIAYPTHAMWLFLLSSFPSNFHFEVGASVTLAKTVFLKGWQEDFSSVPVGTESRFFVLDSKIERVINKRTLRLLARSIIIAAINFTSYLWDFNMWLTLIPNFPEEASTTFRLSDGCCCLLKLLKHLHFSAGRGKMLNSQVWHVIAIFCKVPLQKVYDSLALQTHTMKCTTSS